MVHLYNTYLTLCRLVSWAQRRLTVAALYFDTPPTNAPMEEPAMEVIL